MRPRRPVRKPLKEFLRYSKIYISRLSEWTPSIEDVVYIHHVFLFESKLLVKIEGYRVYPIEYFEFLSRIILQPLYLSGFTSGDVINFIDSSIFGRSFTFGIMILAMLLYIFSTPLSFLICRSGMISRKAALHVNSNE
jgi:hypothetical protein